MEYAESKTVFVHVMEFYQPSHALITQNSPEPGPRQQQHFGFSSHLLCDQLKAGSEQPGKLSSYFEGGQKQGNARLHFADLQGQAAGLR